METTMIGMCELLPGDRIKIGATYTVKSIQPHTQWGRDEIAVSFVENTTIMIRKRTAMVEAIL